MSSLFDFLNEPVPNNINNDNNNLKAFKEDYLDIGSIKKSQDPISVVEEQEIKKSNEQETEVNKADIDMQNDDDIDIEIKLEDIEKNIIKKINIDFTSSEGIDLSFKKKNIEQLEKELDDLYELRSKCTTYDNNTRKLEKMIRGLAAKIESTKFVTAKNNKFRWKRNQPYLVFHKGKGFLGGMISLATFSPFSHVDIVMNGKSYTSYTGEDGDGVGCYNMPERSEIVIYELNKDFDYNRIIKFFKETEGTRYGFTDAVRGKFNMLDIDKSAEALNSYFCSQWVIAALDESSRKTKRWHGKPLLSQGYNWFSPINLFDYMINSDDVVVSKKSLTTDNSKTMYAKQIRLASGASFLEYSIFSKAFGEEGEEDIPSGELGEEGPIEDSGDDGGSEDFSGGDDSGGFDDGGYDDGGFDGEEGGEENENVVKDPLKDIDDSQKELVGDLRKNMSSFYKARENDLEKILSSNVGTSEYGKEVTDLIDNYKTTLSLYETYLRNEYYNESTTNKIMSFVKYKSIFNRLNENLNKYFELLGVE